MDALREYFYECIDNLKVPKQIISDVQVSLLCYWMASTLFKMILLKTLVCYHADLDLILGYIPTDSI